MEFNKDVVVNLSRECHREPEIDNEIHDNGRCLRGMCVSDRIA
jgi:hypothetical protein